MNFFVMLLVASATWPTTQSAYAGSNPCKGMRDSKQSAHRTLHECLRGWAREGVRDPVPTEDCSARLSAFIAAAKESRACHVEQEKSKKDKKHG